MVGMGAIALSACGSGGQGSKNVVAQVPVVPARHSDAIKVCQVGYLPAETKFAMLTEAQSGDVVIRRVRDNAEVLRVTPGAPRRDADSGDEVRLVDFTSLKTPGTYYIDAAGLGTSYSFTIGKDAFAHAYRLAMRAFTGQRCGTAVSLAPDFPQYHYPACHITDGVFDPSSGKTGTKEILGGWHDAGDFGRYVVNSGITTGTLLWAYELNASKVRKINLDLPESGNKTPDMLNEIRWNLSWMLKMQDDDGGVWHKATSAGFAGFVMPEADKAPILIIGSGKSPYKTTASTADLAAVAAIGARVFRPFDKAFADQCLRASEKAWIWVVKNPNVLYERNPAGIATGGYGDNHVSDERLWAAAELFRTTGKPEYGDYFKANYTEFKPTIKSSDPQGWPSVGNMAMFTYALSGRKEADPALVSQIKADAVKAADELVAREKTNGYLIPMKSTDYYWGSNAVVANYGMMLRLAHRFSPKPEYVAGAQNALHYLLGRNTFDTSFVTWVGSKWMMHPHHRPSAADGVDQPWPGMLSGGPNANGKTPPARQWEDNQDNYTVNEMAINWNAPLVFLLTEALP